MTLCCHLCAGCMRWITTIFALGCLSEISEDPKSRRAYLTTIREYFARVKMFVDLFTYDDKI